MRINGKPGDRQIDGAPLLDVDTPEATGMIRSEGWLAEACMVEMYRTVTA